VRGYDGFGHGARERGKKKRGKRAERMSGHRSGEFDLPEPMEKKGKGERKKEKSNKGGVTKNSTASARGGEKRKGLEEGIFSSIHDIGYPNEERVLKRRKGGKPGAPCTQFVFFPGC